MRTPDLHSSVVPVATTFTRLRNPQRLDQPAPLIRITTRKRGVQEWSTIDMVWQSRFTLEGLIVSLTPKVEETWVEVPEPTPLESMMETLLREGRVSEDFVVDLFSQQAIYDEKKDDLQRQHVGKETVICGGKVFAAETFDEALAEARREFPNRPYYSVSFGESPVTF